MADLDVLRFNSYAAIPDAAHMALFQELAGRAHKKMSHGSAELTEAEWHALTIMNPGKADELHRRNREKQDQQQQLQQKQAPPVGGVQLAQLKEGDDLDTFFDRCKWKAAPVYIVSAIWTASMEAAKTLSKRVKEFETRAGRLDALEARVISLEARPIPKWAGTWAADKGYAEGNLVTRGGGLWLAVKNTAATPGESSAGWRLIVKGKGVYANE